MHLACVGVSEFANLKVDDDERFQAPVKEQQVNAIPLVADAQPPLPANEGKVVAQFQQEIFQPMDKRRFQAGFRVFVPCA